MQTKPVGESRALSSEVIDDAPIPNVQVPLHEQRQLGLLADQASVSFAEDFAIADEDLLGE